MKRSIDLALSLMAIVLLSPILLLLVWQVRRKLGRPVIFRQLRPGLHGQPFELLKFRTMANKRDAKGNSLPDSERLQGFGKLLRSTSLDELPELWNVLKGEMSLVGPRPLLMEYMDLYSAEQARRHDVRPGITGWAQVNGRNALSWEEKFTLDVWYVDNKSMILDIKVLFRTIMSVFRRDGISAEGQVIMQKFTGSGS